MNKIFIALLFICTAMAGYAAENTVMNKQAAQAAGAAAGGAGLRGMNPFSTTDSGEGSFSELSEQVQSNMGLTQLNTTGEYGGEVNLDYGSTYTGSMQCIANKRFIRAGIVVEITDCEDESAPVVQVCDSMMRGTSCDERWSPENAVDGETSFSGSSLEGTYTVDMTCSEGECDISLTTGFSQTMGGLEQRQEAENKFSGDDDHLLQKIEDVRFSEAYKDAENDVAGLDDCLQQQLDGLNQTGEMSVNCDPGDSRSILFPVDDFENTCTSEFTSNTCSENFPYQEVTCQPQEKICEVAGDEEITTCNEILTVEQAGVGGSVEIKYARPYNDGYAWVSVAIDYYNNQWSDWNNDSDSNNQNPDHNTWTWHDNGSPSPTGTVVEWTPASQDTLDQICEESENNDYKIIEQNLNEGSGLYTADYEAYYARCESIPIASNFEPLPKWTSFHWYTYSYTAHGNSAITYDYVLSGPDGTVQPGSSFQKDTWTLTCDGSAAGTNGEAPTDESGCMPEPRSCVDTDPRVIDGITVERECWNWEQEYVCSGEPKHQNCDTEAMEDSGWVLFEEYDHEFEGGSQGDPTESPIAWSELWEGPESCDGPTEFGCSSIISSTPLPNGMDQKTRYCYIEEPGRCNSDEGCSVVERTCTNDINGFCIEEEQKNSCMTETGCGPGLGVSANVADAKSNFSKVVAASALMEQVEAYGDFDALGQFRVFEGEERRCKEITGKMQTIMESHGVALTAISFFFGGWGLVTAASGTTLMGAASKMKCCEADPSDIEMGASMGFCTQEHVDLAAARLGGRAKKVTPSNVKTNNTVCINYATFLPTPPAEGEMAHAKQICNHWTRPQTLSNTQLQFDVYEKWCEFDTMLGRLIQEQGREQLKKLAASGVGGATTQSVNFPFYGNGDWISQVAVNGNEVAFWQWDDACIDEDTGGAYAAEQQLTELRCPTNPDVYAAVCSSNECGDLPSHPLWDYSHSWDVFTLQAEVHKLTALNRFTVIEGGCYMDGGCEYDIHAWPAGAGGQLRIPIYMNWPLRHTSTGWDSFSWSHNNVHFRSYTYDLVGGPTPEPKLQMCVGPLDGCEETDWNDVVVNNPINTVNHVVHTSPRTTLMGDCGPSICDYTAWVEVNLTAMPWYSYSESEYDPCMLDDPFGGCLSEASTRYNRKYIAHCSGFNLDQFMALDIDAMDLSEFTQTMSAKAEEEFHKLWKK